MKKRLEHANMDTSLPKSTNSTYIWPIKVKVTRGEQY